MNVPDLSLNDPQWGNMVIGTMILAAVTLVIMAVMAIWFSRVIKRMKKKHWSNQKIVEKRMEVFDRMAPMLNDIYSFFCYVGNWKEIAPPDLLSCKRGLDKEMNIYSSLFSEDLSKNYRNFMLLCFVSSSGWEHDEKIKSLVELRREHCEVWDEDWIKYFDTNNVVEAVKIKERYEGLIESFKVDLVVFQYGEDPAFLEQKASH